MKIEVTLPQGRIFTEVAVAMALKEVAVYISEKPPEWWSTEFNNILRNPLQAIRGNVAIDWIGNVEFKVTMR